MTVTETMKSLAEQYANTAEFYANYAKRFEPGSLGYVGNMNESAKYAQLAAQAWVSR